MRQGTVEESMNGQDGNAKRVYNPPTLVVYGAVSELTAAGSTGKPEGMAGVLKMRMA